MWRYNIHYKYISTLSMKYNCNCFILNIFMDRSNHSRGDADDSRNEDKAKKSK